MLLQIVQHSLPLADLLVHHRLLNAGAHGILCSLLERDVPPNCVDNNFPPPLAPSPPSRAHHAQQRPHQPQTARLSRNRRWLAQVVQACSSFQVQQIPWLTALIKGETHPCQLFHETPMSGTRSHLRLACNKG